MNYGQKPVTILDLKKYFEEQSSAQFAKEWKELTDEDKTELKVLLGTILAAEGK